ncbi:MAG: Hsp70 family protein, partial [Acidimicrobiia bacterium]|nr:Hsp70 family protein [Acidimicrobiia bacterium]
MGYQLGIDLGTTYSAAAVARDGRVEVVGLGNRAPVVPSVVFLREDEMVLTGEAAQRRAVTEPERIAREFKRRVGDPTPVLLGGTPYSAEALMAKLLRGVFDVAAASQGGEPDAVAVSHPANWGPYKKDLLQQSVRLAGLSDARLITEPEAAAVFYASQERVEPGSVIAVYDLGGGTFDAAILRKLTVGFELMGVPEGIERLGGIDFDAAVLAHVNRSLDGALEDLDLTDQTMLGAVARLRADCVEAKEALSVDTEVSIPVMLPELRTEVRLTRVELEAMIRPTLLETLGALRRALASAGVTPEQVSTVLLVGGSSRIPLVGELVGHTLGRPVAVDAHPKHSVALGAALAAAGTVGAAEGLGPSIDPVVGSGAPSGAAAAA